MEALISSPQVVKKVFLSEEVEDKELRSLLRKLSIPTSPMRNKEADRMVGFDTTHQGIIAVADTSALLISFDDFISNINPTEETMLVLLAELTDPHNVGAIIRSAAAFGASGVLMPVHNQAPITGAVVKSSAGMAFRVPLVTIGNINYTLDYLRKNGFKTYALAMDGKHSINEEKFDSPSVFVVGNEGKGIREKTFEKCDVSLRIPMDPRCESLNASVSAAVVLYEWSRSHPKALRIKK